MIDEVHMLSKWAFNALLKTIEEPKDHMCFILATTEIHKVPDTIVSRCQVFNFKKVLLNNMVPHLKNISNLESLSFDDEALHLIAKISEWCVRDAIKYIDQVSVFGNISMDNVTKFLGIAGEFVIKDFLDLIKSKDRNAVFQKIDDIHNQGIDLVQFARQNIMYIDQNLMSDVDFLIKISEAFSEIISTVKYYPYPTMVYKVALNKYLWSNNPEPIIQHTNKEKEVASNINTIQESYTIAQTQPENIEKLPNSSVDVSSDTEEKKILNKLVDGLESKTLKDNLINHAFIQSVWDSKVNFIVINKMAEILMTKDETRKMLEEKLSQIIWRNVSITLEFQSKEDYFAQNL